MNIFAAAPEARKSAEGPDSAARWTRYLVPIGRTAFSAAFLLFGPMNISQQGIAEAPNRVSLCRSCSPPWPASFRSPEG